MTKKNVKQWKEKKKIKQFAKWIFQSWKPAAMHPSLFDYRVTCFHSFLFLWTPKKNTEFKEIQNWNKNLESQKEIDVGIWDPLRGGRRSRSYIFICVREEKGRSEGQRREDKKIRRVTENWDLSPWTKALKSLLPYDDDEWWG